MRFGGAVLVIAIAACVGLGTWLPESALSDTLVSPGGQVTDVFALGTSVVLRRDGSWMRIVRGRPAAARGVPVGSTPSSIGRDRRGRVIMTFETWTGNRAPFYSRWWVYDPASDTARRLRVPTHRPCFAEHVALWRTRLAFSETCWQKIKEPPIPNYEWAVGTRGIVLVDGRRVRRAKPPFGDAEEVALRGRSLAAVFSDGDGEAVWRIVDDGRWCPGRVFSVDLEYEYVRPIAIRQGSLAWGISDEPFDTAAAPYGHFMLADAALAGRCQEAPQVRVLDAGIPDRGILAVAIGTDALYYATAEGVYRHQLARAGSTAPPSNDDFEHATPIGGSLPLQVFGRTAYATTQPGEPTAGRSHSTVWYAFTPSETERVYLDLTYGWGYHVFTGAAISSLTPLLESAYGEAGCELTLAVQAGETYRISVAGGSPRQPNFRPFVIRISRDPAFSVCRTRTAPVGSTALAADLAQLLR